MIKNDRQYALTKAQIQKMSEALAAEPPANAGPNVDPRLFELHRRALESQISDLHAEVAEYDELRAGARVVIPAESLEDLPRALIQTRITRGLTQRALAERLGMPEQQIQRYEATEYESASFTRLKEIARALGVEVPSTIVPNDLSVSPRQFFSRLRELGFDREVVLNRVLPADVAATLEETPAEESPEMAGTAVIRAGALVSRVLNLDVGDFFSSAPLSLAAGTSGSLQYKRTAAQRERARVERLRGTEATADAYTVYVHYLALLLLEATAHLPQRSPPDDPREVRRILREQYAQYGGVTLDGVLRFVWDLGVPVLPLADPGAFHGACWRVGGRNVIALKQRTPSVARWLFDVLHEVRHAGQHRDALDFQVVERQPGEDGSHDEVDAMQFAGDVVLDGRAEAIAERAVDAAAGRLQRLKMVVPNVAAREGVEVDSLANYLAYRLAQQGENWWGAANNLQRPGDPWRAARDVLVERIEFGRLNPIDRQLLLAALRAPAPEPTPSVSGWT